MKNLLKWTLITLGGVVALVILILLVVPFFVDVQKYKPLLEKKVSEMTGRPFEVRGDVQLSFFPFVGVSFADLHLGNPPEFEARDFVAIKSFDVRVKVWPLLARDVQVKRLVVNEPQITLIKNKQGRGNWEFNSQNSVKSTPPGPPPPATEKSAGELPIRSLTVGDFSVSNGSVVWIDKASDTRNTIENLDVKVTDLSFDRPIKLMLSARMDDQPLAVNGSIGPVGRQPGKDPISLDLEIKAVSELALAVKGRILSATDTPRADLTVAIAEFSPRKLLAQLGRPDVIETADPAALTKMSLQAAVAGGADKISLSKGTMTIDDTRIDFNARIAQFSRPDVAFEVNMDRIDLDRYLPPKTPKKSSPAAGATEDGPYTGTPPAQKTADTPKTDYAALRRLVLDGQLKAGEVIVNKAKLGNFFLHLGALNGVLQAEPLRFDLYGGNLDLNGNINVSQNTPRGTVKFQLKNVQAAPLLKDQIDKDFLKGLANATANLSFSGDDAGTIKKTLTGSGDLRFADGEIKGIDLIAMIQNIRAAFGKGELNLSGSGTEFTELVVPFAITNGVVSTDQTRLQSHVLDALVVGKADLVNEKLDLRIEPKVVRKLGRQQDDQKEYSKVTVPVLISGTFSNPKFMPDLESMAKQQIQEKLLESDRAQEYIQKKGLKKYEDTAKGLLKNFLK
ncbi:MAG: AsmA family protein [Desulfobacterales bacterium]